MIKKYYDDDYHDVYVNGKKMREGKGCDKKHEDYHDDYGNDKKNMG